MAVRWRYQGGGSEPFEDQVSAEAWLSAEWASLTGQGVDQVALYDGDELVYEMSLLAP